MVAQVRCYNKVLSIDGELNLSLDNCVWSDLVVGVLSILEIVAAPDGGSSPSNGYRSKCSPKGTLRIVPAPISYTRTSSLIVKATNLSLRDTVIHIEGTG